MYILHTKAEEWEAREGLFQPPSPDTLLVGYLPPGDYERLEIVEAWSAGSKVYLTLYLSGRGKHETEIYSHRRDGTLSWNYEKLLESAGVEDVSQLVNTHIGVTITDDGNLRNIRTCKISAPPQAGHGLMGWSRNYMESNS